MKQKERRKAFERFGNIWLNFALWQRRVLNTSLLASQISVDFVPYSLKSDSLVILRQMALSSCVSTERKGNAICFQLQLTGSRPLKITSNCAKIDIPAKYIYLLTHSLIVSDCFRNHDCSLAFLAVLCNYIFCENFGVAPSLQIFSNTPWNIAKLTLYVCDLGYQCCCPKL